MPDRQTPAYRRQNSRIWWSVLLLVWALSAAYTATHLKRGWVPHDEGAFAQSAGRVLAGEVPHRDFDELYTGGLSYLHAFAFRTLGINLVSLRLVLFIFFLAWVPALYYVASRFGSAVPAGGVTLLAVTWSVPNYAAAVPSWYNLFLAVFGIAALLRYLETNAGRWLFIAGVCGGLSVLAKIMGLCYIASVLLFLVFREQSLARARQDDASQRGRIYPVFAGMAVLLFVALLAATIRSKPGNAEIVHFVLPGAALGVLLLWRESEGLPGRDIARFAALFRMLLPFCAGVAIPITTFLIPYVLSGSLSVFINGVFVLPAKRLTFATVSPPALVTAKAMLPLAVFLGIAMFSRMCLRWFFSVVIALGLAIVLLKSAHDPRVYWYAWHSLTMLIPLIAIAGLILLRMSDRGVGFSVFRQQQVMLLLSVTAMSTFVGFPFSAPIYFCYAAPLLALSVLALLSWRERAQRFLLGSLLCFYILFAILRFTPSFIYAMGYYYQPEPVTQRLTLARAGGLRVQPKEAQEYERLIPVVQGHAVGGYVYAAPDCPEVYFLSGLRNPTRTLFDFFDDPAGRTERILGALETHQVKVVAILSRPAFSGPMAPDLQAALVGRFPYSTTVGRFQVRWRP